jgi:hypothetical protein
LQEFFRDGKNTKILEQQKKRANDLDLLARADYHKHKTDVKIANPNKKICTVLKSPTLRKEFIIGFGYTTRDEVLAIPQKELLNKMVKGTEAILKAKCLSPENIIGITLHLDEKGLPHCHIQYNSYSFTEKTTDTQIEKCQKPGKSAKQANLERLERFSNYQTILSLATGIERGVVGSKSVHKSISDVRIEQQNLQIKKLETKLKNLNGEILEKTDILKDFKNFEDKYYEIKRLYQSLISSIDEEKPKIIEKINTLRKEDPTQTTISKKLDTIKRRSQREQQTR